MTGYDELGHTVYTKLGNGAETTYAYDKERQRLQEMNLSTAGSQMMQNKYEYDKVDNILSLVNNVNPQNLTQQNRAKLGGMSSHSYQYDELNRLISAQGKAKSASYDMSMTFNNMSMPTSKVQTVDSTETAQSYHNTYLYDDKEHPTAPTQIGNERYQYDANGNPILVTNDSLNTTRELYWDEENRLMVLSDNGKTSRYTYNHAGDRIVKSHGDLEGVYINGAPQGITFHEHDEFTLYPASIISVNKNRFTKHYFIGDKRIASKLGSGRFNNVYGRNGSYITAGQQDYAERLNQIEQQREEYYKDLGIAPGVPTMKGAYGDPENTGVGYNTIITELGDHSVPKNWEQFVVKRGPGETPGPPIIWSDPQDPEDAQPGYGFIPDDSGELEETFFYHSDHLGSTSYITDQDGNITQYTAYLPYGELLVDEHSSSEDLPYKFNGKELDEETGLYYYGARYMQPVASVWYGVDPLMEKYPHASPYVYCANNLINAIDPDGKVVIPVHGTWSDIDTWENLEGIVKVTNNIFGDNHLGKAFPWSGGNYTSMRTEAAKEMINEVRTQLGNYDSSEPITLVGHSHGGNVIIEAVNMMAEMDEFKGRQINLLTINTPVRDDYQLSEKAQKRVNHVNVYDPKDPIQIRGGNSIRVLPDHPSKTKFTGEYGKAGRTFKNAKNIKVDNPQGIFGDWHNSHNRVEDWIDKIGKTDLK